MTSDGMMRDIINSRRRSTITGSRHNNSVRRQNILFNNGYSIPSPLPAIAASSTASSPTETSSISNAENLQIDNSITNSTLQYRNSNTLIDIFVNNLTREIYGEINNEINEFYSHFEYNNLNIRFFHNVILNESNLDEMIEHVITNVNHERLMNNFQGYEINNFINDTMNYEQPTTNSSEIISKIENNTRHGTYETFKPHLVNHTCPILLDDFKNNDKISLFVLCSHGIHNSTYEKFVSSFTKCPLCNCQLF